jgi:hypothetical protein
MNESLLETLLVAVGQQLGSPETPFVRKTYERLVKLGLTETIAREQIAICLGEECEIMFRKKQSFDIKGYRERLDALPFEEDETISV